MQFEEYFNRLCGEDCIVKMIRNWKQLLGTFLASTSMLGLTAAFIVPIFTKKENATIPIVYIDKPQSFNWVSSPEKKQEALFSASMNGLVRRRDSTYDNLGALNKKVLTFSPSGFLEIKVGKKLYNLKNEKDARYFSNILSNYLDYTTPSSSFLGNEAITINQRIYSNYSFSMADNIEVYEPDTFQDLERGITNNKGRVFLVHLKDNLKWADGTNFTVNDFMARIQQQIDNNSLYVPSEKKAINRGTKFERELLDNSIYSLNFAEKDVFNTKLSDLINNQIDLSSKIRDYNASKVTFDFDYQTLVLALRKFYSSFSQYVLFFKNFFSIYNNLNEVKTKRIVEAFDLSNFATRLYKAKLNDILDIYNEFTKVFITMNEFQSEVNQLELAKSQLELTFEAINTNSTVYTSAVDLLQTIVDLFQPNQNKLISFINKIQENLVLLVKIKEEGIRNYLVSKNLVIKVPDNYNFSSSENFVSKLNLPQTIAKNIDLSNTSIVLDYDAISGNDINKFCTTLDLNVKKETRIDETNLNFKTINKNLTFQNTEEMCDSFTLVYKDNNNIIFRFATNIEIDNFLEFLVTPEMYPLKSKDFIKSNKKDWFQKQASYGNDDVDYIANGAFKIKAIDYEGITFEKNLNFWNKKNVVFKKFRAKYIVNHQNDLNQFSAKRSNEFIFNDIKNSFLKNYKGNNYVNLRFQNGTNNLLFNIYQENFTHNYFNLPIGSTINWNLPGRQTIVNNYILDKRNECIIENGNLTKPNKTIANYMCGIIPEYREFVSAFRNFSLASLNVNQMKKALNLPQWKVKETFIPASLFIDSSNIDYVDYVKKSVSIQNNSPISPEDSTYNNYYFSYTLKNRRLIRQPRISTFSFFNGIMNINGNSDLFTLNKGFHPTYKKIINNKKSIDAFDTNVNVTQFSLDYAKRLWNSIVNNAPSPWLENLRFNVDLSKSNYSDMKTVLNEVWFNNLKDISEGKVVFAENEKYLFSIENIYPSYNSLEDYYILLNQYLKKQSYDLDSIQRITFVYFLNNIKALIDNNSNLLTQEKALLYNELTTFKEEFVNYSLEQQKYLIFTEYLNSNEFKSKSDNFKFYLFSQIESFYLREGLIIPITGPREILLKFSINAPLINNEYFDLSYGYFCEEKNFIFTFDVRIKKEIKIVPANCIESLAIKNLYRRLGNE